MTRWLALLPPLVLAACDLNTLATALQGDAARAAPQVHVLLRTHGCVHCHAIDGVPGAEGQVGPPLRDFRHRRVLAGQHPNTIENLTRFLLDPRALSPGSAMPRTVDSEAEARLIANYLHGLHRH